MWLAKGGHAGKYRHESRTHARIQHTSRQTKPGRVSQYQIKRRNGEQTDNEQRPLHPAPRLNGARTVVGVNAGENRRAHARFHVVSLLTMPRR
jgi:hypothetical protein